MNERFTLYRTNPAPPSIAPVVTWVMLNPSTADDLIDDPTIRRVMGFSWREGYGELAVINLFSQRSTKPKHLVLPSPKSQIRNIETIERHVDASQAVICAWGATIPKPLKVYADALIAIIRLRGTIRDRPLLCLGTTADGSPRHPLYVAADTPLQEWKAPL